jgi:acetyl esterase/lipase
MKSGRPITHNGAVESFLALFPAVLQLKPERHACFIAQRRAQFRWILLDNQFHLLHEPFKIFDELLIQRHGGATFPVLPCSFGPHDSMCEGKTSDGELHMGREIMDLPAPRADARIAYGSEPLQFGDLRLPSGPGPHPIAVVVHGGFWRARYDLQYIGHLCAALTGAGFATWNLEYRRLDLDGGWPNTLIDVGRGADSLRVLAGSHALDLSRVVSIGHSAGGHLALWLAARSRIPSGDTLYNSEPLALRGAVSLAGVADLCLGWEMNLSDGVVERLMGDGPANAPERYATASPAELLPLGVSQVLVHGTADESVPYAIAERYTARAVAAGDTVRLITLPGADHFAPVDPRSPAWPHVLEAVTALSES